MTRIEASTTRRREIIEAAIQVLTRDGLAETTTRKIAAQAHVNQATLRYYFGSKDDLLFAVLQEMMRQTNELVSSVATTEGSLREAIAAALKAFWSQVETSPDLQIMQYELTLYALRNPASAWLAKQQYDGYCSVVETLFQDAAARTGEPCALPFADLARFVIGGLDGLILQFISDRDTDRARHDLDHLITAIIKLADIA